MNWIGYVVGCVIAALLWQIFLESLVEEAIQKVKRRLKK